MRTEKESGELRLQVDEAGSETIVVRVLGEHDVATKDALEDTLREQAGGGHGVVVSLLETQFMDSSVVKALFETDALLRAQGRRLVIRCTASLDEAIRIASAVERES